MKKLKRLPIKLKTKLPADPLTKLVTEVKAISQDFSIEESRAFLVWIGHKIANIEIDEAYSAAQYDGPNDKGLDFFYVDNERDSIFIVQGKYSSVGKSKGKASDLSHLTSTLGWLQSPESLRHDGKQDLAAAAEDFLQCVEIGFSVQFVYAYCGGENDDVTKATATFNSSDRAKKDNLFARSLCLQDMYDLFIETEGPRRRISKATIKTNPKMSYIQQGSYGKAMVATVTCFELGKLYEQFKDRLFDRNVRLYLGSKKGSINEGIVSTLSSSKEQKRFWAYNNGITIVCDKFEASASGDLTVQNFSIVNGCQTTVAIANNLEDLSDDVQVLMKIVSPPERMIDPIIRYTNSQNQIKVWDIYSQDTIQQRLKKGFDKLTKPFFYALRRGEQQTLDSAQRARYKVQTSEKPGRQSLRTIKHDLLGQYLAAFNGYPVLAYRNKAQLFTPKHYNRIFHDKLDVEQALMIWRAGESVTEEVRSQIRTSADDPAIKVLKRGGRLFVLATLGVIAQRRNGNDFLTHLDETVATSKRTGERLEKYAKLATLWYCIEAQQYIKENKSEIGLLIRSKDFFEEIKKKLTSRYETYAIDKGWLKGALPRLID